MKRYTLDSNGTPVFEPDAEKWNAWLRTADLHVADETIGGVRISTLFLALHLDDGQPALWETAVIGGQFDQVRDRCTGSREQAQTMHGKMVERVKQMLAAKENDK